MKIATDLEQSKKLAEILPKETADMSWYRATIMYPYELHTIYKGHGVMIDGSDSLIPAWSLSALLKLFPRSIKTEKNGQTYLCVGKTYEERWNVEYVFDDIDKLCRECGSIQEDLVDACVEMIEKLKEKGLI